MWTGEVSVVMVLLARLPEPSSGAESAQSRFLAAFLCFD